MKLPLLCLFVSLGAASAVAQLPATHVPNVMLDVQNKAAGGGYQKGNVTTATGERQATDMKNYSVTLGITLRNLDTTPNQVSVKWYFFGRKHQDTHVSKEFLVDSGNKDVTIKEGGTESFDIESKAVQTYDAATYTNETIPGTGNQATGAPPLQMSVATQHPGGTRITGWIVQVLVNGQVVAVKGSDGNYEDAARDPKKFAKLNGDGQ